MNPAPSPQLLPTLRQALAAAERGQLSLAEQLYRTARSLAPANPEIAIDLGHVLRHMRRPAEAKAQFAAAVQLNPFLAAARYGLALACQDLMNIGAAEEAFRSALNCDSGFSPARLGLANLCNSTNRADDAIGILGDTTATDAGVGAAIEHALGTARLMKEEAKSALAHFERALALNPRHGEAPHARAVALQMLGREEEALAVLRQIVKDNPANLMAHHSLNQLLYRRKRDDEFLRSYDEAAAILPGMPHFALAKAALLVRVERSAEALELYEHALKLAPGEPVVLQGRAAAQLKLLQVDAAIASYEAALKRAPRDVNLLTSLAAAYLMARAPKKAEAAALQALHLAPTDQTGLGVLSTAWRAMEDGRADPLNRFDEFIQVFDLEAQSRIGNMGTFCEELDRWLCTQHRDEREHFDQSLRGGTQTTGELLRPGHNALLDGLRPMIEEAIRLYVTHLPEDVRHPFLGRRAVNYRFAGSWSSRLKNGGFHANHLHVDGWISSAFYVALPKSMQDSDTKDGWIKFGEPGYDVGLNAPVRRVVQPKVGRLVLFPSYMWHGTVPFHAPHHRTTIAFDVVPSI